jgi:hypothetical protein
MMLASAPGFGDSCHRREHRRRAQPVRVLAARLSPAELPVPPARSPQPTWCGACDEATRMLDFDSDALRPCPRRKPAA